jgi:hypothetical protein
VKESNVNLVPSTARPFRYARIASIFVSMMLVLAACGGDDDGDDEVAGVTPVSTSTAPSVAQDPTPEPTATAEPVDEVAEDTPTPQPDPDPDPEPTQTPAPEEPAPNVELAPELTGVTNWRGTEPLTLEELRGEPVVLVFWNSI